MGYSKRRGDDRGDCSELVPYLVVEVIMYIQLYDNSPKGLFLVYEFPSSSLISLSKRPTNPK